MKNSTRKIAVSAAAGLVLAVGVATAQTTDAGSYSFALFGDMPYTSPALPDAEARYERLIAHMNTFDLGFGIHVGDIKAGNTRCDEVVYTRNLELFGTFKAPIVYTPGDNEWTDCHRTNNGNYAPLDRLARIRSSFFPPYVTLGQTPVPIKRQPSYPENTRLILDKVMVVTIHMPGSNNNRQQIVSELVGGLPRLNPYYDKDEEYHARNAANMAWLDETLSFAADHPAIKGVVVAFQANPFERFLEPTSASNNNVYIRSGFEDFITMLRAKTLALRSLGKSVLAAHGDTHIMRVGQVLTESYPGCNPAIADRCEAVAFAGTPIDTFTRVEVFAQGNVHWIRVHVNLSGSSLFVVEPMLVPGN